MQRYLRVKRVPRPEHTFKQKQRGRPGPDTEYRRVTVRRYDLLWTIDQAAIDYDKKSDGMYPLICNDRNLTAAQVLEAHKGQPTIEKRFEQIKTVHQIAPVFLKNPGRIEALFTLYFLALLVQALIERELRRNMMRQRIRTLPLSPENRKCRYPTPDRLLELFDGVQCHTVKKPGVIDEYFPPNFTPLQSQVLQLLGGKTGDYAVADD